MTLPRDDLIQVCENMHSWDRLRGKRVFLTGASGFVGRWLVETFEWANHALSLAAELVKIQRDSLPEGGFDVGVHAAKVGSFLDDILLARNILDFAVESGVSRLLFTSSGAVYGKLPAGMGQVAEDFSSTPYTHAADSDYARAKRGCESLFCEYGARFGLCAVIARMFTFSGPALPLNANFAIGNFMRDIVAGGPIVIEGDGTSRRSYLYAADLAIWLWTLLLAGHGGRPYNVGSPESVSMAELAERVADNTRSGTPILVMGGPGTNAAASVYVPSVERAWTELGLKPLISLDEGIRRMYAWNVRSIVRETTFAPPTTS